MSKTGTSSDKRITHQIWFPQQNKDIGGQKIAIVGYSHYLSNNEIDHEELTLSVLNQVVSEDRKFPFFTKIRNSFGYDSHKKFWRSVYFFNFIPEAIGNEDAKYDDGSPEMIARGQERFLRFIEEEQPDKVFIFSRKGWRGFPETTLEELSGGTCTPLFEDSKEPNWGTYKTRGKLVRVCGFQHPQFADSAQLGMQVQKFLNPAFLVEAN